MLVLRDTAIFFLEALYVTIMTCRWIILVRGYRWLASGISFFEQILYVSALSLVVTKLTDFTGILMFALGYSVGNLAGSWLEQRLSLGYAIFNIVTDSTSPILSVLRDEGFGVTSWFGRGRDGDKVILYVVIPRKKVIKVISTITELDGKAFVVRVEPQAISGGFFSRARTNIMSIHHKQKLQ